MIKDSNAPKKSSKLKSLGKLLTKLLAYGGCAALSLILTVKSPELHSKWMRHKVGTRVFTMKPHDKYPGGGTGFQVEAASGKSFVITNDHVCEVSTDKQTMVAIDESGNSYKLKILQKSDYSDLCILEGVPNLSGLKLGSNVSLGDIVEAVGHPSLLPLTTAKGEVIAVTDVDILHAWIKEDIYMDGIDESECSKPKNEITRSGGGRLACLDITKGAYQTNMVIRPGSSGSPVVNSWGNVVGVAFAGDRYNWGCFVSLNDLKHILSTY